MGARENVNGALPAASGTCIPSLDIVSVGATIADIVVFAYGTRRIEACASRDMFWTFRCDRTWVSGRRIGW